MHFVTDHWLAFAAGAALALAALAWWGDRRRLRRQNLDRVGLMPWTGLFFWSLLTGVLLLAAAVQSWRSGS